MLIDSIQNGIVIDHITAGKAMELYQILGLDKPACTVAILKNVTSGKLGRQDIIKIGGDGQHHPRRRAAGKAHAQAARAHPRRAAVQESALHHLDRARAAAGVRAHGSGAARLPLPVLRDRGGKMIPRKI